MLTGASVREAYALKPGDRHMLGDFVLSARAGVLVSLGFPSTLLGDLFVAVDTGIPLSASGVIGWLSDIC